ncbi:alpha/beta fold hydrolase, partial [bacterium]
MNIVFLHGFYQDSRIWEPLATELEQSGFTVFTPDLPGFGSHGVSSEQELSVESQVKWLKKNIIKLNSSPLMVVGYSMGARLLLQAMHELQDLVDAFIIESGTNGIANETERLERIQSDSKLAEFILSDVDTFQKQWNVHPTLQPVQTLSIDEKKRLNEIQSEQNPQFLAWSLHHFGTGMMPYLSQEYFSTMRKPVLFLAGEQDKKFASKALEISAYNPIFRHEIVPNCGHRVHLEQKEYYL